MYGKRKHADKIDVISTLANVVMRFSAWRRSKKAKQKLIKELKKLMYQYGDKEWCIELQGD